MADLDMRNFVTLSPLVINFVKRTRTRLTALFFRDYPGEPAPEG